MEGAGAGEKEAAEGPATLKEAAKKRNTDCIYFLASPRMCKKPLDGVIGIPGASSLPTLVSPPVAETSKTIKKESWGLRPCARQKIPGATNEKLVGSLPLSETMPMSYQSRSADENFQNGSSADEFLKFLRESLQDGRTPYRYSDSGADKFLKFLRESLQDGRTPFRYSDVAIDLGRLMLKGKDYYLRSGREDKYYGREQQRTSSKRYKDGQVMSGKRERQRVECPDEIDRSDLRYRPLKQRRLHGPRSVVSSDVHGKPSWKDDRGQASCRKDHCLEAEKYCGCCSIALGRYPKPLHLLVLLDFLDQ